MMKSSFIEKDVFNIDTLMTHSNAKKNKKTNVTRLKSNPRYFLFRVIIEHELDFVEKKKKKKKFSEASNYNFKA